MKVKEINKFKVGGKLYNTILMNYYIIVNKTNKNCHLLEINYPNNILLELDRPEILLYFRAAK